MVADERREVDRVVRKLQKVEFKALAARQGQYEEGELCAALRQHLVAFRWNRRDENVLVLVIFHPDLLDLLGRFAFEQISLHYVAEFLVRDFARGCPEALLWLKQLGIVTAIEVLVR